MSITATEQETYSLGEAADYLNRSIGYFNAERKEELAKRGANLGGRGQSSSIPIKLLKEVAAEGWAAAEKVHRTRSKFSGDFVADGYVDNHPDVLTAQHNLTAREEELKSLEGQLTAAKAAVKEAGKDLTAVRRDVSKEATRIAREAEKEAARADKKKNSAQVQKVMELEKEALALQKQKERAEKRLAKAKAKLEAEND